MKQKPKLRILKLESCGGCIQKLTSNPSLLEMMNKLEFTESSEGEPADYLFVEGFALSAEQQKTLADAINNAKEVVLFGSCSIQPSVIISEPSIKIKTASDFKDILNKLCGCPPTYDEINELVSHLTLGKSLGRINTPVCDDCAKSEIKCLLLKGVDCLGPKTKGKCKTLCMKIGKACTSCRTNIEEEK